MTLRSWLWLGTAALALATGTSSTVHAQVIIGGNGSTELEVDTKHQPQPPQLQLGTFTGTKPLMPLEPTNDIQKIVLKRPGSTSTVSANTPLVPAEKPAGGYKLVIPEEQKITLTPPPGVKVYLVPPVEKKAKPVRKKVAKAKVKPAPKPVVKAKPQPAPKPIVVAKAAPTPAPKMTTPKVEEAKAATITAKAPEAPKPKAAPVAKVGTSAQPKAPTPVTETKVAAKPASDLPELPQAPEAPKPIAKAPNVPVIAPAPPPAPAKLAEVPEPKEVQVAAVTAPKDNAAPATTTPDTTTVALVFQAGDAHLDDAHRSLLKGIVDELEANPDSSVQLMAYARAENRSKSRRLSLSRALAARSYLLQHDIRNTRIQVRAMGDQVPSGKSDRVDVIIK